MKARRSDADAYYATIIPKSLTADEANVMRQALAGMMWGARLGVQFTLSVVALKALPVFVLGGFTSISGAIVGGLLIGATENLGEIYIGDLIGNGIQNWIPYVVALLILLVRPSGLFGENTIVRA